MAGVNETQLSPLKTPARYAAPPQLWAYSVFALAITIVDFVVVPALAGDVRARFVPFTGWLASAPYMSSFFFGFLLIFSPNTSRLAQSTIRRRVGRGIVGMLLLEIGYGTFQVFKMGGETFGNPYLTISHWQPIWTILIPVIWIAVLYSPRMNRFCREIQEPAEPQRAAPLA